MQVQESKHVESNSAPAHIPDPSRADASPGNLDSGIKKGIESTQKDGQNAYDHQPGVTENPVSNSPHVEAAKKEAETPSPPVAPEKDQDKGKGQQDDLDQDR